MVVLTKKQDASSTKTRKQFIESQTAMVNAGSIDYVCRIFIV